MGKYILFSSISYPYLFFMSYSHTLSITKKTMKMVSIYGWALLFSSFENVLLWHITFVHIHLDVMGPFLCHYLLFIFQVYSRYWIPNLWFPIISCPFFKTIGVGLLKLLENVSMCQINNMKTTLWLSSLT